MVTIISYDIQSDKARRKVARILEGAGSRLQKSVFECRKSGKELLRIKARIQRWLTRGDSVFYITLCLSCLEKSERIGAMPKVEQRVLEI